MKVVLELELRPGYGMGSIYINPGMSVLSQVSAAYPFAAVITAAMSNGLDVTKASVTD